MATTTAKAFEDFRGILALTESQLTMISQRREITEGYLQKSFGSSSNLILSKTILIGSAGRKTIIRPVEDVDVMAIFNNTNNIFDKYRYDSKLFIYRIRDALNEYQVQVVGARSQAVRLFYKANPHVDIAPVFRWDTGGFIIPNGSGGWNKTDPILHDTYMAERDKVLDYYLKPLIKMLKRWNLEHSSYFRSFHLEILTASLFSKLGSNYRQALEMFFRTSQGRLSVFDPADHSTDLSNYLSLSQRQNLVSNLDNAHQRSVKALNAESAGDHKESIHQWQMIFGSEFPSFTS